MPWSNQGGGKKGGGGNGGGPWGQGPWGGGPSGGGKEPPDLDEILRRGQDRVKRVMRALSVSSIRANALSNAT